ncbi:MAG: hypothetical protein HC904_02035 [Blastochloris sp.]|nr:hypothetical protein [Blastochloris sp.]
MLDLLIRILAPGASLPEGQHEFTVSYDGMNLGWAFFLFVILTALAVVGYLKFAPGISKFRRVLMTSARILCYALLLLFLVRPVLLMTIEEPVRQTLLVLLDVSQSMTLRDKRSQPDDQKRAALAAGLIAPDKGLKQNLPGSFPDKYKEISRGDLLRELAANKDLNLWPRLYEKANLEFHAVGRYNAELGSPLPPGTGKEPFPIERAAEYFSGIKYEDNLSALGDGLRSILDKKRGQPLAGVLLVTDGANNSGVPPVEVASLAKQDGIPLFIYAVGTTAPNDIIVSAMVGPRVAFLKEKTVMTVKLRSQSMAGREVQLQLKADGKVVDTQPVTLKDGDEQEVEVSFTPEKTGEMTLEAFIEAQPDEAAKDNNSVTNRIQVVDNKIKVLYIEQEPRWDFRYLLAMLQRDRRLEVKCVLLDGDPGLSALPDSPFLEKLPDDKGPLFDNQIIILGDVKPEALGETRMKLINEWVEQLSGGLILLSGPKNNPYTYVGTPLEPLFPVELDPQAKPKSPELERYPAPTKLLLTPAGEVSPLLSLSEKPEENLKIWRSFQGVRWTARVSRAKPSAETLLVDPTPEKATREGPMPVIAIHSYGGGQVLYFGMDETYRWRHRVGEKYYTRIWGQIMQSFSLQRLLNASATTQIKTDRPRYMTGEKAIFSGKIYKEGYDPLTDPVVPGILTFTPEAREGQKEPVPQKSEFRLQAVPDRPGEYRAELLIKEAGAFSYSILRDANASLKFEAVDPRLEFIETGMNLKMLEGMAASSDGKVLREEDLDRLPDLLAEKSGKLTVFKKVDLVFSPWLLLLIVLLFSAEWLMRRLWQLK